MFSRIFLISSPAEKWKQTSCARGAQLGGGVCDEAWLPQEQIRPLVGCSEQEIFEALSHLVPRDGDLLKSFSKRATTGEKASFWGLTSSNA